MSDEQEQGACRSGTGLSQAEPKVSPLRASIPSAAERGVAEDQAREMLRDLIGSNYSDTTLRVATDHLLSFVRSQGRKISAPLRRPADIVRDHFASDPPDLAKVVRMVEDAQREALTQGIEAGTDETPQAAQSAGREPDPVGDAPATAQRRARALDGAQP